MKGKEGRIKKGSAGQQKAYNQRLRAAESLLLSTQKLLNPPVGHSAAGYGTHVPARPQREPAQQGDAAEHASPSTRQPAMPHSNRTGERAHLNGLLSKAMQPSRVGVSF